MPRAITRRFCEPSAANPLDKRAGAAEVSAHAFTLDQPQKEISP
jgi:hypothetical protein